MQLITSGSGTAGPAHKATIINEGDGVSTARSPFYGALLLLSHSVLGLWGIAFAQYAILLVSVFLFVKGTRPDNLPQFFPMVCLVCFIGGAGLFSSVAMPDAFAAFLIISASALLAKEGAKSGGDRAWWFILTVAAISFHKSHLLLGLCFLVVYLALCLVRKAFPTKNFYLFLLATAAGATAHAVVDWRVHAAGLKDGSPPFLLARVVGDGTAEPFLRRQCARQHLYTCRFLPRMPMTENQFLWSKDPSRGAFATLGVDDRMKVIKEQPRIVLGAVLNAPVRQLSVSLSSVSRQIFTVGASEYHVPPLKLPHVHPLHDDVQAYVDHGATYRGMALDAFSRIIFATYVAGFILICWSLMGSLRRNNGGRGFENYDAALFLTFGVLANAAICAVFAGVFDRYQGRVAWLMPLAAILAVNAGKGLRRIDGREG